MEAINACSDHTPPMPLNDGSQFIGEGGFPCTVYTIDGHDHAATMGGNDSR
jgi:hypothetical protein